MPGLLIADGGSTKTDWCLLHTQGKPKHYKTSGINPYLQTDEEIREVLSKELKLKEKPGQVIFYGAGASQKKQQEKIATILQNHFGTITVEIQGDLLGAARALCGDEKGVVCILGTGSNCCYYDGSKIKDQHVSLGYIAGDEGSGNYLGKKVLQYYAYKTFDAELSAAFESEFGNDLAAIIQDLYAGPFPNRKLACFVKLLKDNRGHYMVENILEDGLNDFFHHHILKYRQSWKFPIHFTGAVAYEFRDVIYALCGQYELQCGRIERSPMDRLVKYYQEKI